MMSLYRTIRGTNGTQKRVRDRSCPSLSVPNDMISRRRILSRSRDDLNLDSGVGFPVQVEEEEDVWYNKDKLYKDHIQEVLDKWTQIDDEIWAKVIVLERNRRVAKAYARAPILTVNGSDEGFDGYRIGVNGFDNPMRDPKTEEVKKQVGLGVKVKMDDQGNILVKRLSGKNVYVKSIANSGEETSIGADVLKLPNYCLENDKPVKLFDMKKFQQNVSRELRRAYPDRRRLECQCLSAISFVKNEPDMLDSPIWVLIINVVAMDMLKSKLPPMKRTTVDIKNRPRIPIPDEDPYSIAGANMVAATREQLMMQTAARRGDKPPKLPPRDPSNPYPHDIPKPDYDDIEEEENRLAGTMKQFTSSRGKDKVKDNNKKYDDPYYCGLRARVPNFVKTSNGKTKEAGKDVHVGPKMSTAVPPSRYQLQNSMALSNGHLATTNMHYHHHTQPAMWHTRSFDSGMDAEVFDSPYNHIYGRLPIPTRGYIPTNHRTPMYVGEWD
ncbi:uncharacterized protein LOC112689280 isoform X2 [Sipha flava]|nr:uncharacterized protein LOC112689280 isoform X2 [Sipha flava]